MKHVLVVLAFVMLVVPAFAVVVGQGDKIPHSLETLDQNETVQSFTSLKGERGAVLVFVRSADWCPYCQVQLLDLRGIGETIEDHGYNLVAISYDAPEKLKAFSSKYNFPFAMLSDRQSEIIKAFGILNTEMAEDTPYYGIPYPRVYIVSAEGVVQHVLSEEGYKKRPSPEDILELVKR